MAEFARRQVGRTGLTVTELPDLDKMPEANRRRFLTFARMRQIMEDR